MAHIARASRREQDICVFIGRFQPLHAGHMSVILRALEIAEFLILVIGSANAARRPDTNPWFEDERAAMIYLALPADARERVRIVYAEDSDYNTPEWTERVYSMVTAEAEQLKAKSSVSLIGHAKDNSSYYLKLFPQWGSINVPNARELNATQIRENYLSSDKDQVEAMFKRALDYEIVPKPVLNWLRDFQKTDAYGALVDEFAFIVNYDSQFDEEKWPRNHVTADLMTTQASNILLIQRKDYPFKGCWALPGGFVKPDETVREGSYREGVKEESGLKVSRTYLERSFVGQDYFDAPNRDPRGRFITHVFHHNLEPQAPPWDTTKTDEVNQQRMRDALALPKLKAGDDAADARWFNIGTLDRRTMAFDHYSIIRKMMSKLPSKEI